ncbi:SDR family NAD(P)-dependent oxidoreductase [Chthonobacter rhizosphaerae]|uniref:SDR family NAD(P)-dependent oxidoreductase n=1 Tax=Chthonobacter rhizosphaerae TaxID=2735553 RepID=UPI0015EF384E|nr:SDR family NAD(P)-dependent oxidoreductase [Chthonobacter rhizosphaerae]
MAPLPQTPADGVAWVTGASSGIGREVAARLAKGGWRVVVSARSEAALAALAAEHPGRIVPFRLDAEDRAAAATAVARIEAEVGPIALAVLNAGIYLPVKGDALTLEPFTRSVAVNLTGTVDVLVPLIDAMKTRRKGQIAVVSSVAGYSGLPTSAAYGATKAALFNLCESLKFDLDRLGILLQVVSPGFVDTPATKTNPFPMPFLISVETAGERIVRGLGRRAFEITFPRRFTYGLKALRLLPYSLYFPIVKRFTGWT